MKRPSFQFYPSDWLRDTALRSCSTGARGLWIDMICFMHEGKPYGHLKVGDKVILPDNLSRMVGETLEVVIGWLDELKQAGVFEVNEEGAIFSRRMIRDEGLRQVRAAGGIKGGNPALKVKSKVNLEVKQKPTPSSTSTSTSSMVKRPAKKCPKDFEVTDDMKTWVKTECPLVDYAEQTKVFRDYEFTAAKSDWVGTWRNWMRKANQFAAEKQTTDRYPKTSSGIIAGAI